MSDVFKIAKGSRHSKIIGLFGEAFLCNWLSRSGFEVAIVDHTGLDLVAYNRRTRSRLGITVKSRTRVAGTEHDSVNVFLNNRRSSDRTKLREACEAFHCKPWVAIYVEAPTCADLYLLSLEHFDRAYCPASPGTVETWKMNEKHKRLYDTDKKVRHISIEFKASSWDFTSRKG